MRCTVAPVVLAALASSAALAGDSVSFVRETPDLDRWMYAFNATPGARAVGSSFGAVLIDGFDDHDAQFLVGFDTDAAGDGDGVIESGLGAERYEIVSAKLTLTIGETGTAQYDADFDPWTSYLLADDAEFTPDEDGGMFQRPMMLFGAGYRNGFGIEDGTQEFIESSPFGGMGFPVQSVRNTFATDYVGEVAQDISNNVKERFEIFPFAIGKAFEGSSETELVEGDILEIEDRVEFTLDVSSPDVASYLAWSLDQGELRLIATSLHIAFGGKGGGEGVSYPVFFTKEDTLAPLFGQTPRLELEVNILPATSADLDGDGSVGAGDLAIVLAAWGVCDGCAADFDGNGTVDSFDLATLLAAWG